MGILTDILSHSQLYRLRYQHGTAAELIAGVPEDQLRRQVNPGKWSIFENIAHLVAYQPVFLERLHRILDEDSPQFGRYVADTDPGFIAATQQPLPELLERLVRDRQLIIRFLEGMDDMQTLRTASHPKFGTLDIAGWMEFFLLHEAHHLFTIFTLKGGLHTMQA